MFADVDTGVDDAMALVYLLASTDADLVGIASTGGNVDVDQVCRNNLGLLQLCGATDIPVSRGADQPLSAAMRTAETPTAPPVSGTPSYRDTTANRRRTTPPRPGCAPPTPPGELIGLVTGPLTNLALALRAEPTLPSLLRRLVIMGGSFDYRGNTTPVAEVEHQRRPGGRRRGVHRLGRAADAKQIAVQDVPIVCGLNLTENIALTPTILHRLGIAAECSTVAMSVLDARGPARWPTTR